MSSPSYEYCSIHGPPYSPVHCPVCAISLDDQPQKPTGSFLCKTHGWHIEFHCPACPKPDASAREWWIVEPREKDNKKRWVYETEPASNFTVHADSHHVIEKYAYDAESKKADQFHEWWQIAASELLTLKQRVAEYERLKEALEIATKSLDKIVRMGAFAGIPGNQTREEFLKKLTHYVGTQAPQIACDALDKIKGIT